MWLPFFVFPGSPRKEYLIQRSILRTKGISKPEMQSKSFRKESANKSWQYLIKRMINGNEVRSSGLTDLEPTGGGGWIKTWASSLALKTGK